MKVGEETPRAQVIVDLDGMNIEKLGDPRGDYLTCPNFGNLPNICCFYIRVSYLAIALVFKVAQRYKDAALFGLENGVVINGEVHTIQHIYFYSRNQHGGI